MSPMRIAFCSTLMLGAVLSAPMAVVAEVQTTPKPKETPSIQPTPKLKSNKPLPVECPQGKKLLQGKCCSTMAIEVKNGECMCFKTKGLQGQGPLMGPCASK